MSIKAIAFKGLGLGLNAVSYLNPVLAGKLAFRLFASPPKPNVRAKELAFLKTADRHDFQHEGVTIPVYSWGEADAPVVFCAYGWAYNAGRWRHYVPALTEAGYRVVAFDPPGHGLAGKGSLDYPRYVALEVAVLQRTGGCDLVLCHSFGGGCLVEALTTLPKELRPRRAVVMGVFSEVKWIFLTFAASLGLRSVIFDQMQAYIEQRTGRSLDEFDVARNATLLPEVKALLVHDPEDKVVAFRNTLRNHSHWKGSAVYTPKGAGHHLGTAGVTRAVLAFLTEGTLPEGAKVNEGDIEPLPAIVSEADLAVSGGVSDYYR